MAGCSSGCPALDNFTLELTLENPVPYFLELLNHYAWFLCTDQPSRSLGHLKRWALLGPNQIILWEMELSELTDHQINSVIEVTKSKHYWDAEMVKLEAIRFYPIEAVYTEERAYRAEFLHLTQSVSADRIDFLKEKYPDELHFEPYLGTYFYRFNLNAAPFNDVRIRKAFALSVDRRRLVEKVLKGGQTAATSFTPPGTGGFNPAPGFVYDPDAAKALLNSYLAEKGLG